MGKHKHKHRHKKSKKHKKERRHSTSSSDSSSEEWVEKSSAVDLANECPEKEAVTSTITSEKELIRDEWMDLPTLFTTTSNTDRKLEREIVKQRERENNRYNPQESSRELNPYWKSGGDGLPSSSFKKPSEDDTFVNKNYRSSNSSGWRKTAVKNKSQNFVEPKKVEDTDNKKMEDVTKSDDESRVLSDSELNVLAAKLVKAEILGNTALAAELKQKLDNAKVARLNAPARAPSPEKDVILTQTDTKGYSRPLKLQSDFGEHSGSKRKKQKVETHVEGQRVRYFADDDKYSLKQMFENEKYTSAADQNEQFLKLSSKVRKNDDLDDIFTDNIRTKMSDEQLDKRNKDKAISEHHQTSQSLDNCNRCLQSENMNKHLMVSLGDTIYLSVPSHEPVTSGHCFLIPTRHVTCATQLDENEWAEILDFRRALTRMFASKNEEVIFFETAMYLNRFPHMAIECVSVPKEQGELAPIYFKKAIDESEGEWSTNKKLVSLAGRDVRRAIPKGLPYFSVSFGMQEGFAHVIEDQRYFPNNFAQEIIGGILDLHHSKWRKPKRQKFEEQKERVIEFSRDWNKFDCTVK